ncbi:MAG: bifunctional riboflavin kinase/FAD synthetase [Deltaproteobacteria bacterium]|nr:MAG: bifunctional riboflavin kinase/FAD synthetase [Deltaproteobacteria bacterium]
MALKFYSGYRCLPATQQRTILTIGNFDGVHRGHREIIEKVQANAQTHQLSSLVYTFQPHPLKVLVPKRAPALLNTHIQKREILDAMGIDILVEEPFNRDFASLSPEQFVNDVLVERMRAHTIFVGYDFTFGRGGKAGVQKLQELASRVGVEVHEVPPLSFEGIVASSSKVREFVAEGNMEKAQLLLGRPFFLHGQVVQGFQRGRELGFPTANLSTSQEMMPAHGVYACWVDTSQGMFPAVTNVGIRPTFHDNSALSVESHLLDFEGDLYDSILRVHFVGRVRSEQSFSSAQALRKQIELDIGKARAMLADPSGAPPEPQGGTLLSSSLERSWKEGPAPIDDEAESSSPSHLPLATS